MNRRFGLLLLAPILFSTIPAQVSASREEFEVASIRRNLSGRHWFWGSHRGGRWVATNASVKRLVSLAWKTPLFEISGGPAWVEAEEYDISAKEPEGSTTDEEFLQMLQTLLIQRFALKVHAETRVMPIYLLLPAKGRRKLPEATSEPCLAFAVRSGERKSPTVESHVHAEE